MFLFMFFLAVLTGCLWLAFKITGTLLLACVWLFIKLPLALLCWILGAVMCCTILLIPVGLSLFRGGMNLILP